MAVARTQTGLTVDEKPPLGVLATSLPVGFPFALVGVPWRPDSGADRG